MASTSNRGEVRLKTVMPGGGVILKIVTVRKFCHFICENIVKENLWVKFQIKCAMAGYNIHEEKYGT